MDVMKDKRILITGGAGFIGSNLAEALLAMGNEVIIIDDCSTGDVRNIASFRDKVTYAEGSITDRALLDRLLKGVDFVLHQAAIPSVPRSVADPIATNAAGIDGTLTLLVAAKEAKVKRVVFASSSSVYGDSVTLPKVETMVPNPLSPYAVTKVTNEHYARVFYRIYGLETVALRYFNVFGPRQSPKSAYAAVIPRFITALLKGERPTIYGDGQQSRDFTYIENVIQANILACTASDAAGKVFNVATGKRYTLLEVLAILNRLIGTTLEPNFEPGRAGDVKHSLADIGAAEKVLGYRPTVGFEEGLRKTMAWLKRA